MAPPLAGITVVDFGMYVAGPYVSVILGDLGARVVKVEPLGGEPGRVYFRGLAACNRGKRAISIDMKSAAGAEIVRRICEQADVVHHNFKPGVSARLGVDASTLRRSRPGMIVLETPGYGASGPRAELPGFDMIFQAYCGHEYHAAGEGNPPLWYRFAIIDFAAGMLGAMAVLGALYRRRRTGEGAALSVSLFDTGIYLLSELLKHGDGSVAGVGRMNPAQTGFHPAESLYQTKDGWIAIAARDDAMAAALARVLGCEAAARRARARWGEPERSAIATRLREFSTADSQRLLRDAGVWMQPCRTDAARQLLSSAALRAVGTSLAGTHPKYGGTLQIGPCVSLSATSLDPSDRDHIPALGEHTRDLLPELGYAPADIDALYARKVVA
ncbi:MAG TPA: CoA transferase [Steroidobacteraceae bacterium]|nr:CoA transferase [Steroidobacteraceae bacterium]